MANEISQLVNEVCRFSEDRDWDQFQYPKDLAMLNSKIKCNTFYIKGMN